MSEFIVVNWLEMLSQQQVSTALISEADDTLTKLALIVERHRQQATHINGDGRLSHEGKTADLAQLAQSTAESLEREGSSYLEALDQRILELEEMARAQEPEAANPVLEFLKQQEVRTHLLEVSELEILERYQSAAESGLDDLFMRSVEQAPTSFSLISDPEILEAGRRARGMRSKPELAGKLQELRATRGTVSAAVDTGLAVSGIAPVTRQLEAVAGGDLPSAA